MAGITSLSPELLEYVFDFVVGDSDKNKYSQLSSTSEIPDTRPSTVPSLLLVNKAFYATAKRFRNRHQHLVIREKAGDSDTEKTAKLLSGLLYDVSKKEFLKSISALTITYEQGWRSPGLATPQLLDAETFQHRVDEVANLVAKIPKLRTLTFMGNFPIPICLLHILEKHQPQCHLHIRDWHRTHADTDHNDSAEIALANSPNLRSITADIWGDGSAGLDLRIFALKRIVSLSPHLESVEIREGNFGCLIRSYSKEEIDEMEKLGALFDARKPSPNNIKSLKSRGGNHVKMLEDVTDVRELESLDLVWIYDSDFFLTSDKQFRFERLKHLSVRMGSWYDPRYDLPSTSLQDFLALCPPLESLKITDRRGRIDLSTIVANHGRTLRKLHLHERERVNQEDISDDLTRCLSLHEIRQLRNLCPELQEFTADLERSMTQNSTKEILEELAQFQKLQKITLYLPLGLVDMCSNSGPRALVGFQDPLPSDYVLADPFNCKQSTSWLENIYSFLLYQKGVNKAALLKELHIKLGEWEREPPMGLAAGWECLEGRNKRYFILTRSEKDDCLNEVEIRMLRLEHFYEETSVKEEREFRKIPDWEILKEVTCAE